MRFTYPARPGAIHPQEGGRPLSGVPPGRCAQAVARAGRSPDQVTQDRPASRRPQSEEERSLPEQSVLVVEDTDEIRELVATVLGRAGFDVRTVGTAAECMEEV